MYDDDGNWIGDDDSGNGSNQTETVQDWTDNGDGTVTDPSGNIFDYNGNWVGSDNGDGSWTSDQGQIFDNQNNFLGYDNGDGTWTDIYGTIYGANNQPIDFSGGSEEPTIPSNWIDNQNGTVTDPASGDVWGIDGAYLGNTADGGLGGSHVTLAPDEFGDVYTVNGKWIGNVVGLPAPGSPNATSARGPGQGTPGGAYSSGGALGGNSSQGKDNSAQSIIQALQKLLNQSKTTGAPFTQQAAIASALRNAKGQSSGSSSSGLLIAAAVAIGAVIFLRRQ